VRSQILTAGTRRGPFGVANAITVHVQTALALGRA
jgi:hypothetical protein